MIITRSGSYGVRVCDNEGTTKTGPRCVNSRPPDHRSVTSMASAQHKTCPRCGTTFQRNPKYSRAQWAKAEFCSLRCSRLKDPVFCACGCGEEIPYRRVGAYKRGHATVPHTKLIKRNSASGRWYIIDRNSKIVYWSRVVAEDKLGRPLLDSEIVHHIDRDKENDDPANLKVFASQAEHAAYHVAHGDVPGFRMAR